MKEFLSQKGYRYQEKIVDQDHGAMEELVSRTGKKATPVVLIEEEVVVGFDRGQLKRILSP